jgi:hypothetical protein
LLSRLAVGLAFGLAQPALEHEVLLGIALDLHARALHGQAAHGDGARLRVELHVGQLQRVDVGQLVGRRGVARPALGAPSPLHCSWSSCTRLAATLQVGAAPADLGSAHCRRASAPSVPARRGTR